MKEKEKASSDLVKRHKNTIFTVCYLFSKDQEEANDLFQDTLINLWRGFDSFQEDSFGFHHAIFLRMFSAKKAATDSVVKGLTLMARS